MAEVKPDLNNNAVPDEKSTFKIDEKLYEQMKNTEMVRGEAPKNIEKRCLELCQTFIAGSWASATIENVEVKRISGGLTNQLWHVKLRDGFTRVENDVYGDEEPSEVAIKLFQPKHMQNYHDDDHERLNDIIILTVLAEAGIGPKVYGIFDDGFIQAYHKHEQFRAKHQNDPKLLDECIGMLAKIHHTKLPIRKNKNILLDNVGKRFNKAYETSTVMDICKEANYKNLLNQPLDKEWQKVVKIIEKINAPTVFCHCDFRGSNLLVTDNRIVCVDLEYSNYGSRPYDISTILNEWGKVDLFDRKQGRLPNEEEIKHFLSIYIDHCERLMPGYKSKPENQLDVLYRETRVFFLVVYLFILSMMITMEESIIPGLPFDRVQFIGICEVTYGYYIAIKEKLIEDGLLDKEDDE